MPGEPVDLWRRHSCATNTLHTRLRVQRAPGFPCALCLRGWLMQQLGHIAPRDRGLVPAIGITSLRGTKATKRSPGTKHENGVSSTQRPLGSDTGLWNTGSPAFADDDNRGRGPPIRSAKLTII